ncbi:MAG: xanthine dehydrogenase family protein molybdopterin-binding subunit [Deltaproteobacteria bacterium]|nr:xanthine dehydrogenase family protein molybdopterin-binding subunit [Deltaproteobacteria bacterium]
MVEPHPSRRGFLGGVAAGGALLSLAVTFGCGGARERMVKHAESTGELAPNMYITVLPDGRVRLTVNKAEMGQGVGTGYATLVAEELGVPLERIDVAWADSRPEYRTSFFMHQTGGSTSTKEAYVPLRRAAAAAREMLVGAAAATWKVPAAECTVKDGVVAHAASARSLGFGALTKQAAHQPVPARPRLKKRAEYTVIGKAGRRVDARAKVDGSARYGIDVVVPDMVHAYVIHGPQYGAAPKTFDAEAARKRPGVIDVLAFDFGVAVVAHRYWQALAAARDVTVTWKKGTVAGLDTEAMRRAMRDYKKAGEGAGEHGDVDRAMSRAHRKIEAVYEAPYLAHATMEPQNCTVAVRGKRAEVWAPCQSPTLVQAFVADAIGGSRDDVLVHTTLLGGGFGRRFFPDFATQCARIAKRVKKPVKMIWSRESDMTQAFYRPQLAVMMRGALSPAGALTGFGAHVIGQSISFASRDAIGAVMPGIPNAMKHVITESIAAMLSTNTVPDMFATEGLKNTPYKVPNLRIAFTPVNTELPVASWRSVGNSVNAFAAEGFLDELAHAAGADPIAFRRALLPARSREVRVMDAVADLAKWGRPVAPGIGRGFARHTAFESEVAEIADVELVDGRIVVRRVYCAVDCGVVINPDIVRAQIESAVIFGLSAALDQQITLVDGVVQQSNYDTFPLLRMFEAPEIHVTILDSDADPTGVGEPGLPPIAPAVANAVFALTKVRLRRMPLQPAFDEAKRGAS